MNAIDEKRFTRILGALRRETEAKMRDAMASGRVGGTLNVAATESVAWPFGIVVEVGGVRDQRDDGQRERAGKRAAAG